MAETHLRNGLRLLKDLHTDDSSSYHGVVVLKPSSHAKVLDNGIVRSFATMHVQEDLFGRHLADINLILQPMEIEIPFPTFANVEEAKDCLDKVLHGILLSSQRFRGTRVENEHDWSALGSAQEQAMDLLTAWLGTYHRTTADIERRILSTGIAADEPLAFGTRTLPSTRPITREPVAYRLLLNYHAMATIMCKTLRGHSEPDYEAYTAEFMLILEGSIDLWKAYLLARAIPNNVKLSESISEFGYIPPLYYTAIKCRNHRIRLHAVKILSQIPHKEGVWDSAITASIGRKVMRLEEADLSQEMDFDDEFPLEEVPDIDSYSYPRPPDSSLFHEVQVDLQDEPASKTVLTCKRWRIDGSLEVVRCQFDGRRWIDIS
ncbi:Nn.00g029660.m01.CDS01 [Neocucurbitaria sp. VM-36]